MLLTEDHKFKNIILIGDKVLIKPVKYQNKTSSGLYLPPSVQEKEQIQKGYVHKTGPGFPIPDIINEETWKPEDDRIKYIPLQPREGDLALFLINQSYEIIYLKEKYYIAPQTAILMLEREEDI